jgi:hypothetical protein
MHIYIGTYTRSIVTWLHVPPQLLRCQYLYFCTSKASKVRTWSEGRKPDIEVVARAVNAVHEIVDGSRIGPVALQHVDVRWIGRDLFGVVIQHYQRTTAQ